MGLLAEMCLKVLAEMVLAEMVPAETGWVGMGPAEMVPAEKDWVGMGLVEVDHRNIEPATLLESILAVV